MRRATNQRRRTVEQRRLEASADLRARFSESEIAELRRQRREARERAIKKEWGEIINLTDILQVSDAETALAYAEDIKRHHQARQLDGKDALGVVLGVAQTVCAL